MRRSPLKFAPLVFACLIVHGLIAAQPNIIVIFSDDQGYADVGLHSVRADVQTPHIDDLADRGIRMTHGFVTAPQCMPSRVGILTGRYQQHGGVEANTTFIQGNPSPGMRQSVETIATALQEAGYTTGMAGKWGVGGGPKWTDILSDRKPSIKEGDLPLLPSARGFDEYFSGVQTLYVASHDLNGDPIPNAPQIIKDEGYRTEVQGKAAVSFIDRHANDADPFFLYYAPYSPHAPFKAPQKYLDRFKRVDDEKRRTCLAMIASLDDTIGDMMSALRRHQILEDTMIWYISDNGAPKNGGGLNAPFSGWKGSLLDGGLRVPFVLSWPGRLPAGKEYAEMVSALDVFPTCLAAAGATVANTHLDGTNLLPFLEGTASGQPHEYLFFRWLGNTAIRSDQWKLLKQSQQVRLFSLSEDPAETVDLSSQYPQVRDDLEQKLSAWLSALPAAQAKVDRKAGRGRSQASMPPTPAPTGTR